MQIAVQTEGIRNDTRIRKQEVAFLAPWLAMAFLGTPTTVDAPKLPVNGQTTPSVHGALRVLHQIIQTSLNIPSNSQIRNQKVTFSRDRKNEQFKSHDQWIFWAGIRGK